MTQAGRSSFMSKAKGPNHGMPISITTQPLHQQDELSVKEKEEPVRKLLILLSIACLKNGKIISQIVKFSNYSSTNILSIQLCAVIIKVNSSIHNSCKVFLNKFGIW